MVIKEDGGCVGLFANTHAILKWVISSPFIIELLNNETVNHDDLNANRHEDKVAYDKTFRSDCKSLCAAWLSCGNPFEKTHPGLVHQISKQILSEEAAKSVRNAYAIDKEQYSKFNTFRESLYDTISKNNLLLYRQKNVTGVSKSKQQTYQMQFI